MRNKMLTGCLSGIFCLWGCTSAPQFDYGSMGGESKVLELAVSDLKKYVSDAGNREKVFEFEVTDSLPEGEFGFSCDGKGKVIFRAGDAMGVTHAVYTYLEKMGYLFDLTGTSVPEHWAKAMTEPFDTLIKPDIRWRGIRQHVNFPMDISSYTLEDAKEYIDRLVRMRFNKLTIHSYPGQWYETYFGDSLSLAGNYFYGNKHVMYDNAFLQEKIKDNDSLFCIPEAERLKDNPQANSKFALSWMKALIDHAKSRGLYVQFSFEPRVTTVEQTVATVNDLLKTYPDIDALELITEETGGWGAGCTRKETEATLNRFFEKPVATDSAVTAPIQDKQSDLNTLYMQIGIISKAIKQLNQGGAGHPEFKLGIYSSITPYTKGAYRLARLALPETKICLMSSHGSEGTAQALPSVVVSPQDRKMTEIYSWIEFDGLMYLYQNSIGGNEKMMKWLSESSDCGVSSVLFNHWRTAESRTSARFVAEATLDGGLSAERFYRNYADRLSIADKDRLMEAMQLVNRADVFATTNLGNIGFCWMGAWGNGGSYTWMSKDNIDHARKMYLDAGNLLKEILEKTEKGTEAYHYLAFVCNRVLCSVLYLDAFREAVNIQRFNGQDQTEDSQAQIREICDKALLIFDQYMAKHAEMLEDRGCEGTLVSVWNSPIRGLKIYRSRLGGVPMDGPSSLDAVDAPPLPIVYE